MDWQVVFLIITTFCGSASGPGKIGEELANECRKDRITCVDNGIQLNLQTHNVAGILNDCLENPKIFPKPSPSPSIIPIMTPIIKASPAPSPSPSSSLKVVHGVR